MGDTRKTITAVKIAPVIPDRSSEKDKLGIVFDLRAINRMPIATRGNAPAKIRKGSNFDMPYPFEIKPTLFGYRTKPLAAQYLVVRNLSPHLVRPFIVLSALPRAGACFPAAADIVPCLPPDCPFGSPPGTRTDIIQRTKAGMQEPISCRRLPGAGRWQEISGVAIGSPGKTMRIKRVFV
jgi:hypothetical protein